MTISRVQGQATNPTGYNTRWTGSVANGVAQGNLVVAHVTVGNNATTITGPTGWSLATQNQPAGSNATIETSIWWTVVSASQAGQKQWVWTLNQSHTVYIEIVEFNSTNGWPTNPLDKVASGDTVGSPVQATTISSGTTAATSQASEVACAVLAYKNSAQSESSITAGWTRDLEATLANNNTSTSLYQILTVTGAQAVSYVIGSAQYWAGSIATFKDNAAGIVPQITVSPTSMSFSAVVGGSSPGSLSGILSEINGAATNWTEAINYGSGSGWLAVAPTSGSLAANGQQTITVTATLGALTAGTYTATITFTATTGGSTAVISVTFTVANPSLAVSASTLSFTGKVAGANPANQIDVLQQPTAGSTAWTSAIVYGAGSGWLTRNPTSGNLGANSTTNITISVNTASLAVGTYTATITFTATTGGATATIAVTLTVAYANAYQVLLQGQDITAYVDQLSIDAVDALGQGSGAGGSPTFQGRQSTIKFDVALGPANSAYGAGQHLPTGGTPVLVRQGQVILIDNNGNIVWAGYATKYTDITTSKLGHTLQPFTTLEGTDYDAALDRIIVNATYAGMTDVQIITSVAQAYAPWLDLSLMPATGQFVFPVKNFRNVSVQKVFRTIAGITGYMTWVDFQQRLRYVSLANAQTAPFSLSDTPDFVVSFPHNVQEFVIDDNSVINRVTFYGGRHNSGDFTQDLSPLANGNNKVFPLAYYPHPSSTGAYIVTVNGASKVVGDVNGAQTPANTFKSAGGLADVLMNSDAHAITFDVAPGAGTTVLITYQYDYPMTVVITSQASYQFFGAPYLDGYISDSTVFDINTAIQRSKVVLSQQAFGLVTLKVDCWQPGLRSGMTVNVKNTVRGLNAPYLVQQVEMEPLGAGNFVYHLTLGAWDWNLLDVMLKLANSVNTNDTQQSESVASVDVSTVSFNGTLTTSWTKSDTLHAQPYYARSSPVGDTHDAYPGFATISS